MIPLILFAQLVIPSQKVATPPITVPSQTLTITVPKNGGSVKITIPSQVLPAQTLSIPSVTVPDLEPAAPAAAPPSPITLTFTCSGPDTTHLTCTAVKQ